MRRKLVDLAARLDDEIAGLQELEAEVDRYCTIERAAEVERDPEAWLQ
jgi:hypothetical protein